ncbi:hypothetical protein WJX75_009266 [Coccomyxa subellipsoidea]|uniref:Mediator of RNA polymerase II transcription subunit 14 n=1 Tax=Coccomyxa subellipsoidea TaxID=248742 RepID=A0ABR2YEE1_9CHLO
MSKSGIDGLMGDQAALSGGLRLIDVRQILDVFLEQTHYHLRDLSLNLEAQGDDDRKRALMLFLHNTKQRLLRLLIVVKWANKARVVAEVGRILDVAARQANACRDAADQLAYLHGELEDTRVPAYDAPTALEVLQTGDYALLPSCIEELRPPPAPPPAVRRARLRLMDQILRSTLLQEKLPAGVAVASIGGGVVELRCGKLWEARLTLVPAPPPPPKAPAAQQDASGGDGEGNGPVMSQDKSQEATAEGAGPNQLPSPKAEPMEMDVQYTSDAPSEAVLQNASGEKRDEAVQAGGVLEERWRWRVLSAKVLPHFTRTTLMAPQQASQLQGAIEMRMWAALDAAGEDLRREAAQLGSERMEPEPGSSEHGPLTIGTNEAKPEVHAAKEASTNSSAVKEEPKSRQSPLVILHGILRDVGSRLVLNEAVLWAKSATKKPDGRWAKLLRIEPSKTLSLGIRICYWLSVPTVTPVDLKRLQQPESAPPPQRSTQQPQQHTPPSVEIGVAKSGEPSIVACPELVHAMHSAGVPDSGSQVTLNIDLASLATEKVLLRAAQANAAIQLAAIEALLRRSGNLQANNGAIALLAPAADGVASGALPSPVLELSCDREPLISVSVQLRTGRLLLHGGDSGGAGLGQEFAPLLRQEEDRLAALQEEALKQTPAEGLGTVGAAAADRLARSLESLWLNLSVRSRYAQLLSTAQSLCLYKAQIPAALLKAYAASTPLARVPAKNVIFMAFPPVPPLPAAQPGFEGASRQDRLDSLLGKGGAGVQLYLQAEMCRGLQWRYSLVIAGCDAQNMPVKVLHVSPVPVDVDTRHGSSASVGQIVWELLRLQLKALGISYTEEVCLAELPAAACVHMANGQVAPAALKDKTAAAIAASGALQRCLRLHGLHSLRLLDHANGVSGPIGVLLRVGTDSQPGQSAWRVTVQSAYFGGLPASCAPGPASADAGCAAKHISQNPDGLTLEYSFATGGTIERAMADLRRLIRLHLSLARMAALMRAAKGASHDTPGSPSKTADRGIRCRMSATPSLPASMLEAFADMADAGEEELLLDALSVCSCALAVLAAELSAAALLEAGLLPEEVSLRAVIAPYKLRLSVTQGANAELAMGMHLLAGGLIWLAPLSGREDARANLLNRLSRLPEAFLPDASETAAPEQEAEESKGRGPQTAPSVLDSAMEIDGVSSPPQEPPAGSSAAAVRTGLWVRTTAFPAALRTVLKVAAEMV